MGHIKKLTPEYFDEVKRSLKRTYRWTRFTKRHINDVAYRHGISYKTVVQINNSNTYADYMDQVKAQHPEIKYSLRDEVIKLHAIVFDKGQEYHKPTTAQTAIAQLQYELSK